MTVRNYANREIKNMIIYQAKNKVNGKRYIGQTIHSIEYRMKQHLNSVKYRNGCTLFKKALKKYGPSNFTWTIIDVANSPSELNDKETFWIEFFNTTNPEKGYNLKGGGREPFLTEEVKKSIGNSQKGKLNHMYGKKGKSNPTSIPVIDLVTGVKRDSVSMFCNEFKEFDVSKVCAVCRGNRLTYKGHIFRYLNQKNEVIHNGKPETMSEIKRLKSVACSKNPNHVKVKDLTNDILYESITKAVGKDRKSSLSRALRTHNGECIYNGVHYKIIS